MYTIQSVQLQPDRGVATVYLENVLNVLEVTNQSGTLFLWYEQSENAMSSWGTVYLLQRGMTIPENTFRLNSIQKNGRKQVYFTYNNI